MVAILPAFKNRYANRSTLPSVLKGLTAEGIMKGQATTVRVTAFVSVVQLQFGP